MLSFKDAVARAFRAGRTGDEGELERLENEHEGMAGEHPDDTEDAVHVHLHHGDARHSIRHSYNADEGGEDDAIITRLDAMERDHEEMKAQLEEVCDLIEEEGSEDMRRRLGDMRRRGDDARRGDARRRGDDARRREDMRRAIGDWRRAHDEDPDERKATEEWKEEKADLEKAEDE